MNAIALLALAKSRARIDYSDDDEELMLLLATAAADVAHAANYPIPDLAANLPDDLKLAIVDQAVMLFDARGGSTDRPSGLSMAAARVVARYRGVSL